MNKVQKGLVKMLPKGTLIKMVQQKFSKGCGYEIVKAEIFIDYPKGQFKLTLIGENKRNERTGILTEYSDVSDMLLEKVKAKISAKKINLIDLKFDFVEKQETCEVFYITNEDFRESFLINDLF